VTLLDNDSLNESMDVGDTMDTMSDGDLAGDDNFTLDADEGVNDNLDEDGNLEGFDDLFVGDDAPPLRDEDYHQGPATKRARPAFFGRSTKAAERAALRSKFDEGDALILRDGDLLTSTVPSRVPGTFGRRNREKGSTLPAYHKKVSHELDSDDELMIDMREKGYSDRQIADKLAKDGRIRYDQKSIATRIGRIRTAQAEHVDYLLKEGYKEWRLEDVSQNLSYPVFALCIVRC